MYIYTHIYILYVFMLLFFCVWRLRGDIGGAAAAAAGGADILEAEGPSEAFIPWTNKRI